MAARALEDSQSSEASSRVRSVGESREGLRDALRAERRVAEYLRALGLTDTERVDELAKELHAATADQAVAAAQDRYAAFLRAVFGEHCAQVDALWLRAFIASEPSAFLGDVEEARRAVARHGDPWMAPSASAERFAEQALQRVEVPRWLRFALVPMLVTLACTALLGHSLGLDGWQPAEVAWLALFAFLTGLGSVGAWIAVLGFRAPRARELADLKHVDEPLPRSVVCLPVYEEDPERVFAAVAAMRESLATANGGEAFEIFVLSDSRRTEQAAEEERAFRRVAATRGAIPVFYRRRVFNTRHKAGNLAEFFERWGRRYAYAVVLDADSLMSGDTLVALARRMHASPKLALLQAPIALHGGTTLFARAQQFVASVCGPLFMRGLARWAGPHGNYYGHNAVLRVRAFLDCCALPTLAGAPPLGGDILSHDFVEAALLCRAGWEVRMASDLAGSWEESPPTLQDHVARDRRWCQGNLQHVRIACAQGLQAMSRVHMLLGAACYLAGPAWLAFLVAFACMGFEAHLPGGVAVAMCALPALFLVGPRLLGVVSLFRDPARVAAHGGRLSVLSSMFLEMFVSASLTPLLMLHHTRIVISIVFGRHVRWGKQERRARGKLAKIVRAELPVMSLALVVVGALYTWAPKQLVWLAPIWVPWLGAIFSSYLVASPNVGRMLARGGWLTVPTEHSPPDLVARVTELRAFTGTDDSARFRDLVLDPLLIAAHLAELGAPAADSGMEKTAELRLTRLRERALRMGPTALTDDERRVLASDAFSMRWLHREAWRHWPVESWNLAREIPLLPSS